VIAAYPASFVPVVYNGATYSHLVRSPTGGLARFGVPDYGFAKKGKSMRVLSADADARPQLFTRTETAQTFTPLSAEAVPEMTEVLSSMKMVDLRTLAASLGVTEYVRSKADLIDLIRAAS
jgi:hypothetical protein